MRIFRVSVPGFKKAIQIKAESLEIEGQTAVLWAEKGTVVGAIGMHPEVIVVAEDYLVSDGEGESEAE